MDFLERKFLMNTRQSLVPVESLLRKNGIILYYFTSMDCDASRSFDKKLCQIYAEAESRHLPLFIILIFLDENKTLMMKAFQHYNPGWYALPFEDELKWTLIHTYGVTHGPSLIVVRENGELVTKNGVTEVENIGINVLITWFE